MRTLILFIIALCNLSFAWAQGTQLTLETTAGNLHNLLTEEQQKSVTDLTLTGSMDDSDFYFIRDKLLELDTLNIKEVEADTIPERAFYQASVDRIYLPVAIKYIGQEAFSIFKEVIINGKFPELGIRSFKGTRVEIAPDNEFLSQFGDAIYSSDGKILYFYNDNKCKSYPAYTWIVRDGTEVIASRAFDNCSVLEITFPSSLKSIEEHAFGNSGLFRIGFDRLRNKLIFNSTLPPRLAKGVFIENNIFSNFELVVPDGLLSEYQQADEQWSAFIAGMELNLHVSGGNLHQVMTEEQQKNVINLTLTGSMDKSDFRFIEDMSKLRTLNLKEVRTDTIPRVAFFFGTPSLYTIYLPKNIKYIEENAFKEPGQNVILSGGFPKLGSEAFGRTVVTISADNDFLKQYGEAIYSTDGKILYHYGNDPYAGPYYENYTWTIREGTEIIAARAFDTSGIYQITFPSSLKSIGEHAFENTGLYKIIGDERPGKLIFNSTVPPILAKDVFAENKMFPGFELVVPDGLLSVYQQADKQWLIFKSDLIIETTAGNLHNLLSEEQQKSLTKLTLRGTMDDSDFYFIRNKMSKLEILNIKEVEADTIPERAFYHAVSTIYLPMNIKYIGKQAFANNHVIICGDFPKLDSLAFKGSRVTISADNEFLNQYGNAIYSSDGKILYFHSEADCSNYDSYTWEIREGTEVISSRAFDNCRIFRITFPASLKRIEEHAFENSQWLGIAGSGWKEPDAMLIFNSMNPPELAKGVFSENHWLFENFILIVPEGKIPVYKDADEQWSIFMYTTDSGMHSESSNRLRAFRNGNSVSINSEKNIMGLRMMDIRGTLVYASDVDGTDQLEIPVQSRGIYLLKVIYTDQTTEVVKLKM